MFYASKIVWAFAQPSTLIALLLIAGLALAFAGRKAMAARLTTGATMLYCVCGFSPLGDWLVGRLERWPVPASDEALARASGIVVLGGGLAPARKGGEPHLNEAGDRMVEAVHLARRFPSMPIIFSGGKGGLFEDDDIETEATTAARFLSAFGIVPPRLRLEERSRNTFENALYTARLLRPKPEETWILVTSAFHMPRACLLFARQGMKMLPRPADFRTSAKRSFPRFFLRAGDGFDRIDIAAKEWIAILIYWLRGDIAAPFAPCGANGL